MHYMVWAENELPSLRDLPPPLVESDFDFTQCENTLLGRNDQKVPWKHVRSSVNSWLYESIFSNHKIFINSVKPLTRKFRGVLTNQEMYRMRNYKGKAREEIN